MVGVLNDLKNRGLEDVLIFSVDGLTGLKEAIGAIYLYSIKSWKSNWDVLNTFFKFPGEIRKTIYN